MLLDFKTLSLMIVISSFLYAMLFLLHKLINIKVLACVYVGSGLCGNRFFCNHIVFSFS